MTASTSQREKSGQRVGLAIVAVCLLIGVVLGFVSLQSTDKRTKQLDDLFTGLSYFIQKHDGRFPESAEAFRASAFVEPLPGGGLRITRWEADSLDRRVVGVPFEDLEHFDVAWGTDLTNLTIDAEEGIVRNPQNEEVLLVQQGYPIDTLRQFTRDLLHVANDVRGVETPKPGEAPSAPPPPDSPDDSGPDA